MAFGHGFEFHW